MDAHLCIVCGPLGGVDSVLNVVLFVPLGIGLALSGLYLRPILLSASALSLAVETTQFFFIPGRDATLGDVITNTVGAALGFALVRCSRHWLTPRPGLAASLGLTWAALWLVVQVVSGFALAPSTPGSIFYGELAPELGNFDVFPGRVISASVGVVRINDARVSDVDLVAHRFLGSDLVKVTVVPSRPTSGVAPVLRVVDAEQTEIVLLAQRRQEMIFGFHTGAADLRLRPPRFGLRLAFPPSPTSESPPVIDTLTLTGRYGRNVALSSRTPAGTKSVEIPVTAALAWTLFLPGQWFIEGTAGETLFGWMWVALLVVPIGYWAGYNWLRQNNGSRYAGSWITVAALLALGLGVIPGLFGLSETPASVWLATVSGLLVGAAPTRPFRVRRK